ncbi:LOW QUALITY PROTEIN: kelch-like protein 20 [Paramacrobiotus metropolitanus]|uniref:LOW QUALITY PROTEIN: kelch-like protein 20 n=1 Tax=Paramacrobiotus metropolitanus TaxID=2943436 RepID=UPI002445C033|nr:LOW QUALITY PROTEIN: kelch-like protein 20 [Paramacrobiotus metropolitanus]
MTEKASAPPVEDGTLGILSGRNAALAHISTCSIFRELQNLRAHGSLCDVIIKGSEESVRRISCHRLLLSAYSRYFRTLFDSVSSQDEVRVENVPTDILNTLIDCMYSAELHLDDGNLAPLLHGALNLDIPTIAEICWEFAEQHIGVANCLMINSLRDCKIYRPHLAEKAKSLALRHFSTVSHGSDFLQMDNEHLVDLVRSDNLNVQAEDEVFYAVLRWLHYDRGSRQPQFPEIIQHVRQSFCPSSLGEYLQLMGPIDQPPEYSAAERKDNSSTCLQNGSVDDKMREISGNDSAAIKKKEADQIPPCLNAAGEEMLDGSGQDAVSVQPRISYGTVPVIVCVGGEDKSMLDCVECFDPVTHYWSPLKLVPYRATGVGMATTEDHSLFVCGGYSESRGLHALRRVVRYNPCVDEWKDMPEMQTARGDAGVAALNNCVYVVGGCNSAWRQVSTVECYDPLIGEWRSVADLPVPLSHFGIAACEGRLYVFGGCMQGAAVRSGFCYDPKANGWSALPSMATSRVDCSACALPSGVIVVFGGYGGVKHLSSVEAYDVKMNQWTEKCDLIRTRRLARGAYVDGKIYAMGGDTTGNCQSSVEQYDDVTDRWILLDNVYVSRFRCGLSCAVLRIPKDLANQPPRYK